MTNDDRVQVGPGRPRDPELDRRITRAAQRVFRERGWTDATMGEIASAARVSKAALYRRFPSKVSVAFDAWVSDRRERFPNTETGSVWGDLTAFILGTAQMAKTAGWGVILPGLLAEVPIDPAVAEAIDRVWEWRRSVVQAIVGRATERGEMRHDVDPGHVHELIDGPILMRLLVTREPLDMAFTDRVVETVVAFAR